MKRKLFKGKHNIGARIVATVLAVIMVLNMMPASALTAKAAVSDKVTDYSTINEWQEYFLSGDTSYAGGVWTDKSVFKSGSDFDRALSDNEVKTNIATDPDNFLVSMSALATNKEIVGYSTVPTDTMFIIDVSQSMDNSGSIPQTVNAANSAIKKLLDLNKNNRVGIILYSGRESGSGSANTSSGTVLLGLDRYTAGNGGRYITYSGDSDTTIKTETNLKYESTRTNVSSKSKRTIGGTYIQNGLDMAMEEFLDAEPVVEAGNIQEGVSRMPIFVLMSDGAPTHATTSYTDIGTSNMGSGLSTTASSGTAFATQLTAAYARASVEAHYSREARFYTLGLNLADSSAHAVATSILDPEQSYNAINTYWNNLIRNGSTSVSAHTTGGSQSNFTISRPYRGNGANRVYTDLLTRESQYYVNEYFPANNNNALEQAFADIVAEIILQSAYYPTLIEGAERNLSGYVTFRDEIGHHMEVKDVKGILLGDNMFTGEVLAKMMAEGEFGNAQTFTTKGWELVETVSERIGVTEDVAILLLSAAWQDQQLYYEDDEHYSNYIGWYEGANAEYIAFWSQKDDDADVQAAVADGAKYITKSYGYYGATEGSHSILGSDMMHVVVKVHTEIATGLQEVIFEIPASLIPIITYAITLDTESYDTARNITMDVGDETPIRLLFEVGVSSEVNERNLTEIMTAEGAHSHPVLDAHGNPTGEYYFYTNVWGNTNDPGNLDPSKHEVAESVFTPSTVNERYYHVEDAVLYQKSGNNYVAYKGNEAPRGEGYYIAYRVFQSTSGNRAVIDYVYEEVSPETLAYNNGANLSENDNGEWYIKKGTVRRTIDSYHIEKKNDGNGVGGPTNTLMYSRFAQILESEQVEDYMVYSFQGNNGRLKMTPATGIKLTKQVDATVTDANAEFVFNVELDNNSDETYTFVKGDVEDTIRFTNGKSADIKLKAGETVYITGLPGDVTYTVTEQSGEKYKVAGITVNGVEAEEATGTIVDLEIQSVVFTNTLRREGDLVITKTVTHSFGDDYAIPTNKKFEIEVVLKDADGDALANTTLTTSAGEKKTNANGKIRFELAHDESLTIYDLEEGTTYEVNEVETEIPKGFSLAEESGTSGEIVANETATASFVNKYVPDSPTADLVINVTKSLTNMSDTEIDWNNRTFTFYLEKQNGQNWVAVKDATGTVTENKKTVALTIPAEELTSVGNYLFRVREDSSAAGAGIVNDTDKYFTVVVTDNDMDGHLEISQVIRMNNSVDFKDGVAITFNNKYAVDGELNVQIPVEKNLINNTGVLVRPGGFEFGLYENLADVRSATVKPIAKGTSNALGAAVINMEYDSLWFDEQDTDHNGVVTKEYYLAEMHNVGTIGTGSYDATIYTVVVEIGLQNNQLVLNDLTISSGGEEKPASFTNTYKIDSVDFELDGEKTLKGRNIKETDQFEIKMYKTGSDFVVSKEATAVSAVTVNLNGQFTLEDTIATAGTHYYVVEETVGQVRGVIYDTTKYHVTVVTDVDSENATKLKVVSITRNVVGGGIVDEVTFTNEYKATPVSIAIEGTKVLTAKDKDGNVLKSGKDIANGDFTFVLLEADGETPIKDKNGNDIVAVSGLGIAHDGVAKATFRFPEMEYTAAGTYEYVVAERKGDKEEYKYDPAKYTVSVVVTDDEEGTLTAVVSKTAEELEFNNTYTPKETTIAFKAVKSLDGRTLKKGEFKFGIYETGSDFKVEGKEPQQVATNGDGSNPAKDIIFKDIVFKERGTYYFVMKELAPSSDDDTYDSNIVYDPVEYQITVLVWDVDGQLYSRISTAMGGSATNQLFFSNVYVEPTPTSVEFTGTKRLTGRELDRGEFGFELYETDSTFALDKDNVLQVVHNGDTPDAPVDVIKFAGIPYDVDDLNGAGSKYFYYVIKEVVPKDVAGVVYDSSQFRITVRVFDNGAGQIATEVAIDDSETTNKESDATFVFENEYEAADAKLVLGGTKTLDGKDLKENDFEFALYETASDYAIDNLTAVEKVKNKGDGTFAFEEIIYNEEGTYYYAVVEVAGTDSKVTYDNTKYNVKVVVSDNGHGELEADIEYGNIQLTDKTEAKVENLNFTNGFNPDDTVVTLGGHKTLEGKDLIAGAFEFALYETDEDFDITGKTAEQTKFNDAEGAYGFDSLVFTEKGTHYYVVKEVVPANRKGVTYDTTEYRIKVEVAYDKAEGILSQVVTIDGEEYDDAIVEFDELDFTNTYKATLKTGLTIEGQKNLSGDRTKVEDGEFSFTLYEVVTQDGATAETLIKIGTVKNGADGRFIFDVIKDYTEPGIYRYRVVEDAGDAEGMTYDASVYDITVEIVDDGEGNLVVKTPVYAVDGVAKTSIEFNNIYDVPEGGVQTGDNTSVGMWSTLALISILVCGALFVMEKKRKREI